jgi:cytochrome b6-f complex iron-sulfur subunit
MTENERLDQALEALLADQSPRALASELTPEEQEILRLAQALRGSRPARASDEFVEQLHERLFPQPGRISRRTAFVSGLGALAAGIAAGIGLDRALQQSSSGSAGTAEVLIPDNGTWHAIATVSELPEGAIKSFTVGALQGFVLNRQGELRAMSRICTHMGCTLTFSRQEQAFKCPCHGAEFNMNGRLRYGPGGYYPGDGLLIPPLPQFKVRVRGQSVEVFAV